MNKAQVQEKFFTYEKAVNRLLDGLHSEINDGIVVDGVIQRFEFTFELAWNIVKDYLAFEGIAGIRCPRGAIKEAKTSGLIKDSEEWIEMMTVRNQTSYIYDENQAKEIYYRIKESYSVLLEKLVEDLKQHLVH